ncbi:hypothetical protein [Myxococcus hansupus]|nr:hypothetical protein [Myxococcus hansupus]
MTPLLPIGLALSLGAPALPATTQAECVAPVMVQAVRPGDMQSDSRARRGDVSLPATAQAERAAPVTEQTERVAPAAAQAERAAPATAQAERAVDVQGDSQARRGDVLALLSLRCRQWAAAPENPWALAHGMVLDGRAFRTRDGQPAADTVIAGFLRRTPERLFFEPRTADGTPVEPHPALQVKTLLRSGYRLSHQFKASWGPVTVRDLVAQVQRDHRPALAASPEGAWALDALSLAHKPGDTFLDGTGTRVHVDAVMREALATLEAAQAELAEGMRAGRPEVPKRKQGIYAHPCGGLHYFQAVAGWARHARVRKAWRERLDTQVDVLLYRLDSEGRQYEAALASMPAAYRLPLLVQMLKFQGHLLETLGRYRDDTGWRPTPAQQRTVERARTALETTVRRLNAAGAFDGLPAIAAQQPQLALDLVGDTCHAAHGEALWRAPPLSAPSAPAPRR